MLRQLPKSAGSLSGNSSEHHEESEFGGIVVELRMKKKRAVAQIGCFFFVGVLFSENLKIYRAPSDITCRFL